MQKATFEQYLEIGQMITRGELDRGTVQLLIEGRLRTPSADFEDGNLKEDEYLVHVDYSMPHDKAALEVAFSRENVSKLFYLNYEWQPHPSCVGINRTPGNRVFRLVRFSEEIGRGRAIAEMEEQGYRPATPVEGYAFSKAHPEIQNSFAVIILGSHAVDDDGHAVVMELGVDEDIDRDEVGGRGLFIIGIRDLPYFSRDAGFLFVRKDA